MIISVVNMISMDRIRSKVQRIQIEKKSRRIKNFNIYSKWPRTWKFLTLQDFFVADAPVKKKSKFFVLTFLRALWNFGLKIALRGKHSNCNPEWMWNGRWRKNKEIEFRGKKFHKNGGEGLKNTFWDIN